MKTIAKFSGVKQHTLQRHYKQEVSGYADWEHRHHAEKWLLFEKNLSKHISIDEVSLNSGELYTFVTNKAAKGRKGALIAMIRGTRSEDIQAVLKQIPPEKRALVEEITLDMAQNIESAMVEVFASAKIVTDRFHVSQLAHEVVQQLRIKLRWKEIETENEAVKQAREQGKTFEAEELVNGDTPKQLLARSRYVLFKSESKWTNNQWLRAQTLFARYPELRLAYDHAQKLNALYHQRTRISAQEQLEQWISETYEKELTLFYTCAKTISLHKETILNFFYNRSTNASAEAFNAKIKLFRANLRGVVDLPFFLFRLTKIFA